MHRIIVVGIALLVTLVAAYPVAAETEVGIKVHGHWKIETFEQDGTPVSVTEFDNALSGGPAKTFLVYIIGGYSSSGSLLLALESDVGGPCDDGGGTPHPCRIAKAGSTWSSMIIQSRNLVQSIAGLSSGGPWLVFEGSVTAEFAATIDSVQTWYKRCQAIYSPDECETNEDSPVIFEFTGTTVPSPVSVDAGQIVQVTVTISFS